MAQGGFLFYTPTWMKSEHGLRNRLHHTRGVCYTREAREVGDDNMVPRGGVLSDFFGVGKADWRAGPTMPATAQGTKFGPSGCFIFFLILFSFTS
jgi:hypothetical protein